MLAFAFVVILSGCATTDTTSFTDPDYVGVKFQKFCVNADFDDFKYKQMLENQLVKHFKESGIYAVPASQLLPPTREWTEQEIEKTMKEKGIDAYLYISWTDRHVDERYVPGSVTTTTEGKTKKTKSGDKYTETSTTTVNPGSTERTFYSTFYSKIIAVESGNIAWTATSQSESGEGFKEQFAYIMESLSESIIEQLADDGHIHKKKK